MSQGDNYHAEVSLSVATNFSKVYLDECLVVQGGVGLLQPHTLLLVLLQSQRVDGEEGHLGLKGADTNTERAGSISEMLYCFKFILDYNHSIPKITSAKYSEVK